MTPHDPALLDSLVQDHLVLLDGGLATQLEAAGHDVSSALWSAALLDRDPQAVVEAHAAFFAVGAQVAITASYQASFEGFERAGIARDDAARLIQDSVRLARLAAETAPPPPGSDSPRWVAGSVGPYGAILAGGQEYTAEYVDPAWPGRAAGGLTPAELAAFHRPRIDLLADAGADLLACETVPCLVEAEALLGEIEAVGLPAWLTLTTVTTAQGDVLTRRGEPAAEAFAWAGEVDAVLAVGVNCTDPAGVPAAIAAAAAASGKPVVVYPNSGERWNAAQRRWHGTAGFSPDRITGWVGAGARLVGGCCRVGPRQLAEIGAALADIGGLDRTGSLDGPGSLDRTGAPSPPERGDGLLE